MVAAVTARFAGILNLRRDGQHIITTRTLTISTYIFGGGAAAIPANVVLPSIAGTPQVGQTLTANTGTWTNSPVSYAYQWYRIVG